MAGFIQHFKLNSGRMMPMLGLGTYLLKGDPLKEIIDHAVFLGFRHIDTAFSYGNNEDIGDILQLLMKSGKLNRKDLFLTTKIPGTYHAPTDLKYCVNESLEKLRLKSVDLLLIHHPWSLKNRGDGNLKPVGSDGRLEFTHQNMNETWKSMEDLVKCNKVLSLGLSNFNAKQIDKILKKAEFPPSNLQLECHAYLQQVELEKFCKSRGITLTAYSPLGAPARPEHHISPDNQISLLEDETVKTIAAKYVVKPAQVLLRFLIQRDFAVIPKTDKTDRLKQNLDCFNFYLKEKDMLKLRSLNRGIRFFPFLEFRSHPEFFADEPF
ncbi:hypothetical protein CHS0354_003159 [Potamilus streckersoni]|uniref:NADP-dependent oxidoreductase domain-containing protein n=1 Tax=Potamilus streckersoni TaxID=2493646 RepID=A0AAE0T1Z6_9BIVA|nr:hypothetical protein CHS0354_003159 [Potamilus streckersoni]